MKYLIWISTLIFCASPLFAQQPTISYLMCDEAKSQLQIRGSFGVDSGSVSIEDTTLAIISWTDTLIICNLPDSGKGAGGNVVVQTVKGMSNKRLLSIFCMVIDHDFWSTHYNSNGAYWTLEFAQRWSVNWRADISKRDTKVPHSLTFEVSKTSFGKYFDGHAPYYLLPWSDTLTKIDSGISFSGIINLDSFRINFGIAKIFTPEDSIVHLFEEYQPLSISFDTNGMIKGYLDTITNGAYPGVKKTDSLYNTKILFPPGVKNSVSQSSQSNTDQINIFTNDHSIALQSASPLGATIASLYSIDGRLLKRAKLDIFSAGIYTLDVSDVRTHFALLVLQTEKGVITKKILF